MNNILKIVFTLITVVLFTTCKKYPENNLWFKSPDNILINKHLQAFTVNGIDSMPMWDAIYNDPGTNNNGYIAPLKANQIIFRANIKGDHSQLESQIGWGEWHFFNHKKNIYIFFKMVPTDKISGQIPKYNLFLTTESNWKVLKLTKDGNLKIQRTYNDKVYEMEFN